MQACSPTGPDQLLVYRIDRLGREVRQLASIAEFEHVTIVDRITSGIERRAREGRWYSGRPPFGYTLQDGQLTPAYEARAVGVGGHDDRLTTWKIIERCGTPCVLVAWKKRGNCPSTDIW